MINIHQFRIFLSRYINNNSTKEEERVYDDFFEHYQQHAHVGHTLQEKDKIRQQVWGKIEQSIKVKPRILSLPVIVRAAAAVLFFVAASAGIYKIVTSSSDVKQLVVVAQRGEYKEVLLSDSTVVVLNAGSQLSYPEKFSADNRTVALAGEAFFKVKRDEHKPFVVQARELKTTVLGTSFNVSAYDNEAPTITVVTGRVKVNDNSGDEVVLTPGQQAYRAANGKLAVKMVNAEDNIAWEKGMIYLHETDLHTLVNKLERKYNITIKLAQGATSGNCLFNGTLANDKLVNVLENLRFISNLQYSIVSDTVVVINSVSCK